MKELKNLESEIKRMEAWHKKRLESLAKGECGDTMSMPVHESLDDSTDLFTYIVANHKFTVRHIDPMLKTKRKDDKKSWLKVAELGAKEFAKSVKLAKDWDFLFPKKVREEASKQLMKHFK